MPRCAFTQENKNKRGELKRRDKRLKILKSGINKNPRSVQFEDEDEGEVKTRINRKKEDSKTPSHHASLDCIEMKVKK